jgi:5S rRNA maturation endonuclease (ribonuclease M5)
VFDTTGTIVIPVTEDGSDVAWQCRLLYDPDSVEESMVPYMGWRYDEAKGRFLKPPKYFTMPGFDKGLKLFNRDNAKRFPFVVVTEGAFDAMSVGVSAVAAFGKGLTDAQVSLLREWPAVVLLLDPDAAGEQDALERRLTGRTPGRGGFCKSSGTRVVQVRLKGYKDAGECPHGELVGQILEAASSNGVDLLKSCDEDPFESGRKDDESNESNE